MKEDKIKMIVTDLDGSLLNDQKELPADFWNVEKTLRNMGIDLVIASGRPLHNIAKEFEKIQDHTYFISDNGSYIVYRGEELLTISLGQSILKEFIEVTRQIPHAHPVLCGKHMAFVEDHGEAFLKVALQYYREYEIVDDLNQVTEPILKISVCDLDNAQTNSYPFFKAYEDKYRVAVSGPNWLDLTEFEADKGNAVKVLQDRLQINYNETMVFGDYLNDLGMMKSGKFSYAMQNARAEVIAAANFITDLDNNAGGVTDMIKKILGIG